MNAAPGDVGGWFRTARNDAVVLSNGAWFPAAGGFGRTSLESEIVDAFELMYSRPTMVLTGAGMSTDSGLPDYRGRDAVPRSPMTYQEFVSSDLSRRRYWARSTVGWRAFGWAAPNEAHRDLATLALHTPLVGIVTQNVDGLHQRAGSAPVIDLHGNLADVICLDCGAHLTRSALQETLLQLNPRVAATLDLLAEEARTAPDGDAEVDKTSDFDYPSCPVCAGMLKPDVVFFGENAHTQTVNAANDLLDRSEVLLVLGTSLSVMSGLRFVRRSAKEGRDVIIVTDGPTRGDDLATARLHGRLAPILRRWLEIATRR